MICGTAVLADHVLHAPSNGGTSADRSRALQTLVARFANGDDNA